MATSVSGRYRRWADSRAHIWMAWPSSTGVAHDGSRLAYHTPGPGDPLFVSDGSLRLDAQPIFTAPAGLHSHFPLWAPDSAFIYFVQGSLPDKLDIWRVRPAGGTPERITSHNGRVSYPVLLNRRTLLYLASDPDDSGPWLHGVDVERRIPHRLSSGLDRYTSLAASADGRRLVVTLAKPKGTLWRLRISDSASEMPAPAPIPSDTSTGFSPRLRVQIIFCTFRRRARVRVSGSSPMELAGSYGAVRGRMFWRPGDLARWTVCRVLGPAKWADALVRDAGRRREPADCHRFARPAGCSSMVSRRPIDNLGGARSRRPTSLPRARRRSLLGSFLFRSTRSIPGGARRQLRCLLGARHRHQVFGESGYSRGCAAPLASADSDSGGSPPGIPAWRTVTFVLLRGEIQHKNLWLIDLETGAERQLTNLPPDFDVRDFDISPDGREVVLERVQERSDVVQLDLPRP